MTRYSLTLVSLGMFLFISGCRTALTFGPMLKLAEGELKEGNVTRAIRIADSLKEKSAGNRIVFLKADSISEVAYRIRLDFSSPPEKTIADIEEKLGPVSQNRISAWEKKGWLEGRVIDGEKMYFKRAASNLLRLVKFHENKDQWRSDLAGDSDMMFRLKHTSDVVRACEDGLDPLPVRMRITYTLTVDADAVPGGETIRCWLPYPGSEFKSQNNIVFLDATDPDHYLSPDSSVHSAMYMTAKARKGEPTVFRVSFSYDSYPRYVNPDSLISEAYDTNSSIYRKYTRQELPHINFSPEVKRLADSICGKNCTAPEAVRKIYMWFKDNIPWTGALEYSTIPDITRYALDYRRGDCGIQTILFMSMLRYKGIPVRWQSGWMMPPHAANLHDWCEVYYEGTGWVPVDVSYELQASGDRKIKEFYLTGIDAYRLIVNTGLAGDLHPPKEYLRSEPYDFQRGEAEWSGGNLYFDKWHYDMEIEYLD